MNDVILSLNEFYIQSYFSIKSVTNKKNVTDTQINRATNPTSLRNKCLWTHYYHRVGINFFLHLHLHHWHTITTVLLHTFTHLPLMRTIGQANDCTPGVRIVMQVLKKFNLETGLMAIHQHSWDFAVSTIDDIKVIQCFQHVLEDFTGDSTRWCPSDKCGNLFPIYFTGRSTWESLTFS